MCIQQGDRFRIGVDQCTQDVFAFLQRFDVSFPFRDVPDVHHIRCIAVSGVGSERSKKRSSTTRPVRAV